MNKPRIFIGSSTEGLRIAEALQINLDRDAEVTIWTQNSFQLSSTVIQGLLEAINNFDFAIFVFSEDDVLEMRGQTMNAVRDNVIFETGLFAGSIGIKNVFILKPRTRELHLPSDLLGIIAGEYDANRQDGNIVAATAPFCTQVREKLRGFNQNQTLQTVKSKTLDSLSSIDLPTNTREEEEDYKNDLLILETYFADNNWSAMSFASIRLRVHPKFTQEYLLKMIEKNPKKIRQCTIIGGKKGIKLMH
ncbi:MAG: nucleotide-binding protein [Ignavibacteria bacterium]|nr:nucleotide-binding protein [Ignavibacteria bacterium]